jgi:hypothetical protein
VLKPGMIVFSFTGVVSDAEFRTSAVELQKILKDNPGLHELVDYTNVEQFAVSPSTMRDIALSPPFFSEQSVQVFVAPETAVFGMARMYQLLIQEKRPNMIVVRTLAEAQKIFDNLA